MKFGLMQYSNTIVFLIVLIVVIYLFYLIIKCSCTVKKQATENNR